MSTFPKLLLNPGPDDFEYRGWIRKLACLLLGINVLAVQVYLKYASACGD